MLNKLLNRSDLFANNRQLENEFYCHINFINIDRLRIFSYFLLPFAFLSLFADFYFNDLWQQGQLDNFIRLDIILSFCSVIVVYFSNFHKPKTQEDVKPWMVYFIYIYVLVHLFWASAVTIIEEPTSNSLPTYLIGLFAIIILFYLNSTYVLLLLVISQIIIFIGLIYTGKSFNEVLSKYYFSFTLVIIAWVVSRILYTSRMKIFISNMELKNAKNDLDKKVKLRTEELQRANDLLTNEINERKKYEKILEREKKKAEEADNLKSVFLANMSHEIRTPLNGILGFSDLLYKQNLPQQKISRYLDIIHNNGQQLLKIIDDILDISMIASNQLSINKVNFKLSFIFPDAYEYFNRQRKIESKEEVEIFYVPIDKESKDQIFSDPVRIQQVLNNLIHNSLKFTERGFVRFSGKIEDEFALVYVEDSGIGVTISQIKEIFKRFRQGDESSNRVYGGTGLGLSISKGIVELLGGMIWLDSTYKNGARFCFSIPLNTVNSDLLPNQFAFFEDLRKKRILIIEKKYSEFNFLTEQFKELKIINYRTEVSKISEDLEGFDPDIIIFDMVDYYPELEEHIELTKSYCRKSTIFNIMPENQPADINRLKSICKKNFYRPLNVQHLLSQCIKAIHEVKE